jgi:hypothetical protein
VPNHIDPVAIFVVIQQQIGLLALSRYLVTLSALVVEDVRRRPIPRCHGDGLG